MKLEKEEKELLIRALTVYYEKHVWDKMVNEDSSKASDEDYNIRALTMKLGIRDMFPVKIQSRW